MAKHRFEESSADLAADIVESAQQLVRLEIALAKQEAKELALRNGIAIGLMTAGAFFLVLGLFVTVPVLIIAISGSWIAALIWVLLYLVGGGLAALVGWSRLKLKPPERTIASLKETRAWLVSQLTTNGK